MKLTRPQRQALAIIEDNGTAAVSNCTNPELGYVDARVVARLIEAGLVEQVGFNRLNQATVRRVTQ